MKQWEGFQGGQWQQEINVRDFIQKNVTVYTGDEAFLAPATEATNKLWKQVMELTKQEIDNGGVLDMDTEIVSTITSHGPGYLDKDLETVVGFQTDKPFKRSLQPFGGIRMAEMSAESYGFKVSEEISRIFTELR
uniref:pyruvate formate lyase family protein n=1 Tax=Gorillibacterium sp. sgz5001074 TaxID=3446695 RepID=UPI003F66B678